MNKSVNKSKEEKTRSVFVAFATKEFIRINIIVKEHLVLLYFIFHFTNVSF